MEWKEYLFFLLLLTAAWAQDNTTAAPENDVTPKASVASTDRICSQCECAEKKIDCRDKDIEGFFTAQDWAGVPEVDITEIDLSGNRFYNITPFPSEFTKLEVLNLSRCDIVDIQDETFRDLQALRVLDLSHNKLTTAALDPNVFQGRYSPIQYEPLDSLRTLDLSSNDLHSLDKDLFEHTPDLTELVLSKNPFHIIDHATIIAIGGLPKLKVLKMRSCQLEGVPERFLHTPRELEHLDLSDNQLEAVPQELEEAKSLTFLNLNQNPIKRIEKNCHPYFDFPELPKLKELHLCGMDELEYIGAYAMGGLSSLETLHMSNNAKLSHIAPKALAKAERDGDVFVWPPIKKLYIKNNNLSSVDSRLVSRWDQLTALEAAGNPYVCDCTTQWMVDVLSPIADRLRTNASAEYVCSSPEEMAGKTMQQLNLKHNTMRCLDKYNHHPDRDGALLLGTLIGVLLAVPIVLSLVLLWRRGYFARCGASGPGDFSRAFYKRAETDDFHI